MRSPRPDETGAALITVLLLISLSLAMLGGFSTLVVTDQRLRSTDRDRTQAFYGAHGALEQLTADLWNLFVENAAPTGPEVRMLDDAAPSIEGVSFANPQGGLGYSITFPVDGSDRPLAENRTITSGPFQGFFGLITPFTLRVTGRIQKSGDAPSEVELVRTVQTVSIPLFQFGIFSNQDLSFFAGPNFDFGGRVHTNGNLYAASGDVSTLSFWDRVTAVGELIRTNLSNGWDTSANYNGVVRGITAPNAFRPLARDEGSLIGTLGSAENEPTWTSLSVGSYNGNIRNGRTGARQLVLPFVSLGAAEIDLIRRARSGENAQISAQRYYSMASLRILLSDTASDLSGLPGITPTAPVPLGNLATTPIPGYVVDAVRAPFALSQGNQSGIVTNGAIVAAPGVLSTIAVTPNTNGIAMPGELVFAGIGSVRCEGKTLTEFTGCASVPAIPNATSVTTSYRTPENTPLLDGFLKIEVQRADDTWADVTVEILNLGVAGRNLGQAACPDPAPNAVLRLQRIRNRPVGGVAAPAPGDERCGTGSLNPTDYWPNALFDPREGNLRDNFAQASTQIPLGGIMHYVEVDVANLTRWFTGAIGASGVTAKSVNGFTVYFSDRRTNRNAVNQETGEYGFEDKVNPADVNGLPNLTLDAGEDVNGTGTLDTDGQSPILVTGASAPLDAAARPWTTVAADVAQVNRPVFFRRALKLTNGALGSIVAPGLTVVAENPVYIQGNWNANAAGFGDPHVATSVIADAVTLLSNAWNDNVSFAAPHNPGARQADTSWYRVAILAGKTPSFPRPTAWPAIQDFGTDGGVHNFLRYIESWGGATLNYRGSLASFFWSRQANGVYKCCTNVYSPPNRVYVFDTDFLQPALLPPLPPMFRDLNTTGFTQVIR